MSVTNHSAFLPCIIVPFFNHGQFAELLLKKLADLNLPVIIIDDGSDEMHRQKLAEAIKASSLQIIQIHQLQNQGKGAAVVAGFRRALELTYSHALQVDADCQHDFNVIKDFLIAAKQNPQALICGYPRYDKTVPMSRLIPRYITHFWVNVNTLSAAIKDSMCGMRCYPLNQVQQLLQHRQLAERMDFDIDVIVRLYWQGLRIINLPVAVIYHADQSSNFKLWRDNLLISKTHALLFFGMLPRAFKLLKRARHASE